MRTLLIGGNRFVGVEMLWHLAHAGHDVTVLALDSPPADTRSHIRWLRADRNDVTALSALLAGESFDCVIDNIAYEPSHVERLLAALDGRVGRYLLTSTTDIYPGNFPRGYTEDQVEIRDYELTGLDGAARYNYGKRSCEALLQRSGVAWSVLRPCMVTGPRDNRNGAPAPRAIHWFEESGRSHFWVSRVLDGGPILLCGEDEIVFKLTWVGDLARAALHVLTSPATAGQAYNVTGDEIWTNERIVRALAAAAGTSPDIVHVPNALLENAGLDYTPVFGTGAGWTLADNAKLKATGWRPTPAEQWLPLLLEANAHPDMRTWYHTRVQEIALARHIQRTREHRSALAPAFSKIPRPSSSSASKGALPGRLQGPPSRDWQIRAMRQRSARIPLDDFYNDFGGGRISRIGIGTWMGDLSVATDARYMETLIHAASRGINVFDTAINYRHMKAERCVGAAVRRLVELGVPRQALCVATKGGYVTHDADDERAAERYLRETYLQPGLIDAGEASRHHSVNPRFIAQQIDQSLANLCLSTVDVYYLHNPEDEIAHLGRAGFRARLTETFVVLEQAVAAGKIGCYGLATWDGLRVGPEDPRHLSLEIAVAAAADAAGRIGASANHLRALQLPFNVRDHQSLTLPTQKVGSELLPAFEAAAALGLYSFTSASVLQGADVPAHLRPRLQSMAPGYSMHTAALFAVKATPGVGTALVGMRRISNVEEAIAIGSLASAPAIIFPPALRLGE